jgi:hypothetical protein
MINLLQLPLVILQEIMLFLDHKSTHRFSEVNEYCGHTILLRGFCVVCGRKSICPMKSFLFSNHGWKKVRRVVCYSNYRVDVYNMHSINWGSLFLPGTFACQSCIVPCRACGLLLCSRGVHVDQYGQRLCGNCR